MQAGRAAGEIMSIGNLELRHNFEHASDTPHECTHILEKRIGLVGAPSLSRQAMIRCLAGEGYCVSTIGAVDTGHVIEESFDLIVLNLSPSEIDDVDLCRDLRLRFSNPILMLSGSDNDRNEVSALNAGADDFQCENISLPLFLARVNALIRRGTQRPAWAKFTGMILIQDLLLSYASGSVTRNGEYILMSDGDFRLLWLMSTRPDQTWPREKLSGQLLGIEFDCQSRVVDARISNLRKRIGDNRQPYRYIITIRNEGYRLISRSRS